MSNIIFSSLHSRESKYYILLGISYIFYILFGIFFHTIFNVKNYNLLSIIMLVIVPIILTTYNIYWHIHYEKTKKPTKVLNELENELKRLQAPKTIPVILFGLVLYQTYVFNKKEMHTTVGPYLIFALLFGTVFTELINELIFDHDNLDRIIIAQELEFMFLSLSFGLMFMTIYITLGYNK